MIRLLKGAYFWVMSISVTFLATNGIALATFICRMIGRPRDGRGGHWVASLWGRTVFTLTPGWTITVEGRENLLPDGTASVLVCNHESLSDIFIMYFLRTQFRWMSKESVFRLPFVGGAMRRCGYVPVKRGDRQSAAEAIEQSADRLRMGVSMFFFPEGTRSETGAIQPFKLGAFRLAQSEQTPVVPIVLKGARELIPKRGRIPNRACVSIKVLKAEPPPRKDEDLEAYAARIRDIIVREHEAKI